jgi:hypothetical protein
MIGQRDRTRLKEVNRANPCPVCEGIHKCSIGEDGLIVCGRSDGPVPGFVFLGKAKNDEQFTLYRREDDPTLDRDGWQQWSNNGSDRQTNNQAIDWPARAATFAKGLTLERRPVLARDLKLPESVFFTLTIGFDGNDFKGPCWTFPEVNAAGRVIGINRRYLDGSKKLMPGGNRGLTIPDGWREREGPVLCPEGPSDTLALTAMGLAAIGRPSNLAGVDQLAELFKDLPPERPIVILGEHDQKQDGNWPGQVGASRTAAALAARLRRLVQWVLPPDGAKDVRAWAIAHNWDRGCMDEWQEGGQELLAKLVDHYQETGQAADQDDHQDGAREQSKPHSGYQFSPIDSAAFATGDYGPTWLVRNHLVRHQPAVIGGPRKAMKTSIGVDLSISLATGTPFLGRFKIDNKVRVAFLSGESGEHTLQETARRVCLVRGLRLEDLGDSVLWDFRLPQLAHPSDLAELQRGLKEHEVDVTVIEPLYLCLLAGTGAAGRQASNAFDMGPILMAAARACLDVGCTPILGHHSRKDLAKFYEPMDLEDLAFAGVPEFARQWILINRRERYDPGTGFHKLWLSVGGSCGQGGLWGIDIEEGSLRDDFSGRTWIVTVNNASDIRQDAAAADCEKQDQTKKAKVKRDANHLYEILERLDPNRNGVSWTKAKDAAQLGTATMNRAMLFLINDGLAEEIPKLPVAIGSKAKRTVRGVRLLPRSDSKER